MLFQQDPKLKVCYYKYCLKPRLSTSRATSLEAHWDQFQKSTCMQYSGRSAPYRLPGRQRIPPTTALKDTPNTIRQHSKTVWKCTWRGNKKISWQPQMLNHMLATPTSCGPGSPGIQLSVHMVLSISSRMWGMVDSLFEPYM